MNGNELLIHHLGSLVYIWHSNWRTCDSQCSTKNLMQSNQNR